MRDSWTLLADVCDQIEYIEQDVRFGIDKELIWKTVAEDIPLLKVIISTLMQNR